MRSLGRPSFKNAFAMDETAAAFIKGIRNGILHEQKPERVIWRDGPEGQALGQEGDGNLRPLAQSCVDLEITHLMICRAGSIRSSQFAHNGAFDCTTRPSGSGPVGRAPYLQWTGQ
jgi:hypothetical protein